MDVEETTFGEPAVRANVLLQVFIVGQLAGELLGRGFRPAGISPDHFAVLSVIGQLGPVTPTDLSRILGMPPTTVSSWVRRLASRGHITRLANPDDGRSALLEVTPRGREMIEKTQSVFKGVLEEVNARLGRSEAPVTDSLVELQEALRGVLAGRTTASSQ
jgi:DNA-binding MarR family transcriptional regulator